MSNICRHAIRWVMVVVVSAGGLFGATGCANDAAIIEQANQMHGSLEPAIMTDPVLNNYITALGARIIEVAAEFDRIGYGPEAHSSEATNWMYSDAMRFHFVNSQTLNAFTTGGNHMYIYTALFIQSRTEDELAAVMAHEYAHVYCRHVHKGMNRQYAVLGTALLAGAAGYAAGGDERGEQYGGLAASAAMIAGNLYTMGFTRQDEAEADEYGFAFYTRAGWDPNRFGDFFQQMIDKGYANEDDSDFLSTHPAAAKRVAEAKRRAATLPPNAKQWRRPNVATPAEFAQLQERAARLGETMPSDATLENSQELLQALPRSCLTPTQQPDQIAAQERLQKKRAALAEKEKRQGAAR
jgi:predicted Zn-dependent protease